MTRWSGDEEKGIVAEVEDPVDGLVENTLLTIDEVFAYKNTVTRLIYITYAQVIQALETDFYFKAFMFSTIIETYSWAQAQALENLPSYIKGTPFIILKLQV